MQPHAHAPSDPPARNRISIAELSGASSSIPSRPADRAGESYMANMPKSGTDNDTAKAFTAEARRRSASPSSTSSSPSKRRGNIPIYADTVQGQQQVPSTGLPSRWRENRHDHLGSHSGAPAGLFASASPTASHASPGALQPAKLHRLLSDDETFHGPQRRSFVPFSAKQPSEMSTPLPVMPSDTSAPQGLPQTPSGQQYALRFRQQPVHARMCGFGEKDRRPIDPAPILECICLNPEVDAGQAGASHGTRRGAKDPYLIAQVLLLDEHGRSECGVILSSSSRKHSERFGGGSSPEQRRTVTKSDRRHKDHVTRVLMGSLACNTTILEDEYGVEGTFFIFPDLSVRTEGRYTLQFRIYSLEGFSLAANSGASVTCLAEATSQPFEVYPAKRFPGMLRSTEITKAFARQGYKIQVRNDIRARKVTQPATDEAHSPEDRDDSA